MNKKRIFLPAVILTSIAILMLLPMMAFGDQGLSSEQQDALGISSVVFWILGLVDIIAILGGIIAGIVLLILAKSTKRQAKQEKVESKKSELEVAVKKQKKYGLMCLLIPIGAGIILWIIQAVIAAYIMTYV